VRLPEAGLEQALERLVALDREKKLLSRDITSVDLRLPDRVTVRLSGAAAQAREDAIKDKKKKKGGDA
jgi:cell division protein FtsQ